MKSATSSETDRCPPDATVLFSRVLRDYVMYAGIGELVRLRWSESILAELSRTLAERGKMSVERAERLCQLMNGALPSALAIPTPHDLERIAHLALPDEADRHVLAAAVTADAACLFTTNIKVFPAESIHEFGLDVVTPDDLLRSLLLLNPQQMISVHRTVVTVIRHSDDEQTLTTLTRAGAPQTAAALRALLSSLSFSLGWKPSRRPRPPSQPHCAAGSVFQVLRSNNT